MTNGETPRTLDEIRAVKGDEDQVAAAQAYLGRVVQAQQQARDLRDQAVLRLIERLGPSETARRTNLSLSTIKAINRMTPRKDT